MAIHRRAYRKLRRWLIAECTRLLTKPLHSYEQRVPNNIEQLKKALRKGDVVLVEGDQRISQVIRYLTQSSWSHSALYVGDELLRSSHGHAEEVRARFGSEARFLLIEAVDGGGVVASPLQKYEAFNIRVCRPQTLRREDLDRLLADVIGHLGDRYDVRHIFELARYFLPVSLLPRRWRRAALRFGSRRDREVICSSMIANAFSRVGYPITPQVTLEHANAPHAWWHRLIGRDVHQARPRFRNKDSALTSPRDFDLSPYFDIIKFNHFAHPRFNYRDIVWEPEPTESSPTNGTGISAAR